MDVLAWQVPGVCMCISLFQIWSKIMWNVGILLIYQFSGLYNIKIKLYKNRNNAYKNN